MTGVSANGITYEIVNRNGYQIGFGGEYEFSLEMKNGLAWYPFELNGKNWNTIKTTLDLFGCAAGESVQYSTEWGSFFGNLPPGHYRIKKFVRVEPYEGAPLNEWPRYAITAEFTIKE